MNDHASSEIRDAVVADGLELVKAFRVIENPDHRRQVIALARLYAREVSGDSLPD